MNKITNTGIVYLMALALLGGCSGIGQPRQLPANFSGEVDVIEHYANGNMKRKTAYLDGELMSDVKYFSTGTEKSSEQYVMGEVHDATYYFASGRLKSETKSK
jgi:hypothetical protein